MELKTESGIVFKIDEQDLHFLLENPHWYKDTYGYIRVSLSFQSGMNGKLLHRLILNPPESLIVDHINHDKTNCERSNLRICTRAENNRNIKKTNKASHTSSYKGVRWHSNDEKWESRIQINKKQIFLGQYTSEQLAAERYDDAATHFFKEFALLNFPERAPKKFQMQSPLKRHSPHRGISFDKTKKSRPWTACIQRSGVRWQERFATEQEALEALQNKRQTI